MLMGISLFIISLFGAILGKTIETSEFCNGVERYIQEFKEKIAIEKTLSDKGSEYNLEQHPSSINGFIERNGDVQRIFEHLSNRLNISNDSDDVRSAAYNKATDCPLFKSLVQECRSIIPVLPRCNPASPYRTVNGTCNNLQNPLWGSLFAPYRRLLSPHYKGLWGLRDSVLGGPLPLPRNLTLNIHSDWDSSTDRSSRRFSHMFMFFGQLIAHDTSDAVQAKLNGKFPPCCPQVDNVPFCLPIRPILNDPFYSQHNVTCVFMLAHPPLATCKFSKREHYNGVPVFLDAHFAYGRTVEEANDLRMNDGTGYLKIQKSLYGDLMARNKSEDDQFCSDGEENLKKCFYGGDSRVNQHTTLIALQTLFAREHNRMVDELATLNPHWMGEQLYQVARKILGAKIQAMVYNQYLPLLLGRNTMIQHNLSTGSQTRNHYDPTLLPNAADEFASFGFRLHNSVNSRIAETGCARTLFRDTFKNPLPIHEGCMDEYLDAATHMPQKNYDRFLVEEVTNFLYLHLGKPTGQDLATFDIQRGRDHGLAPYTEFVKFWSKGEMLLESWEDFERLMSSEKAQLLKDNYADPRDVDAWVGMLLENHVDGTAGLGPSSFYLNVEHFTRQKKADRFYFENEGLPSSFTRDQIDTLQDSTLSRIICDNSDINEVAENVMLLQGFSNPVVPCDEIPEVDLSHWQEFRKKGTFEESE